MPHHRRGQKPAHQDSTWSCQTCKGCFRSQGCRYQREAQVTGMPACFSSSQNPPSSVNCRRQIKANITGVARGQRTKQGL